MVNEAALLAGRESKVVVEKIDFIHAVERSIAVILSLSLSLVLYLYMGKCFFVAVCFFSMSFCGNANLIFHPIYSLIPKLRVASCFSGIFEKN